MMNVIHEKIVGWFTLVLSCQFLPQNVAVDVKICPEDLGFSWPKGGVGSLDDLSLATEAS